MNKYDKHQLKCVIETIEWIQDKAIQVAMINSNQKKENFTHLEICDSNIEVLFSVKDNWSDECEYRIPIEHEDFIKTEIQLKQDKQDKIESLKNKD